METPAERDERLAMEGYAVVIGDLKQSKASPNRRDLQQRLRNALDFTNDRIPSLQPLEITLGDEFQGMYATLDAALVASLLAQLGLGGGDRVRVGIGTGELAIYEPSRAPFQQDGPAWWAARAAVELTSTSKPMLLTAYRHWRPRRGLRRQVRSEHWAQLTLPGFEVELPKRDEVIGDLEAIVNALLATRDEVVRNLDERDCRIILAAMSEQSQVSISQQEGISQPAVSQRLRRSGGSELVRSVRLLTEGIS